MREVSRRRLLESGAALGLAGILPQSTVAGGVVSELEHSSPDLAKFVQSLPRLGERSPDATVWGVPYHEVSIEEASHSFHPDLPDTTIWGYDGQFPGPIIEGERYRPLAVHFDNSGLPSEHLFEIDERIGGTTTENYVNYDGPVPDVRNVTHVHGLNIRPESDGQAEMWTSPDGVRGPRFSRSIQYLPNRQERLTSSYHDHTRGISRLNNYAGLFGPYYIRSHWEDFLPLPEGKYDVPLVIADRSFNDDGSLHYPDEFIPNFAGDTATVNGAAWPYMEVEPRPYRFRLINLSNGRTYDMGLEKDGDHDHGGGEVPMLHQFSAGHGFLDSIVSIGHGGDMESLVLAPFERADIVVDFSGHAGETFTVTNDAEFPYGGGGGHHGDSSGSSEGDGEDDPAELPELMEFRVADTASTAAHGADPTTMRLPSWNNTAEVQHVDATRKITMQMTMDEHGLAKHTLNEKDWGDGIDVKPRLGSTEVWELENSTMHTHPIHLHLVSFRVLSRESQDDSGGRRPPLPNERGGKDTVRVNPNETVRIAVEFGDYTGKFPFHCHVLEHEEHDMMRSFEVQSRY
jgi:FtsP/CotA-like multicopper oxidase with cupredoxin domain